MNLHQYQQETQRTCPSLGSLEKDLRHMRLGVITEFGELLDPIKKHLAYGKPVDKINLGEEIADICWYLTNQARMEGITFHRFEIDHSNDMESLEQFSDILESTLQFYLSETALGYDEFENFYNIILTDLSNAANFLGFNIEDLWQNNIAKLRIRFPDKFDANLAVNRNVEAERVALNG